MAVSQLKVKKKEHNVLIKKYYDYNLLAVVIIILCFGLVMLYSASSYEATNTFGNDMYYLIKQSGISFGAVVLSIIISRIDYHFFVKTSFFTYLVSIILMAMVKYSPLGVSAGGAKRWLNVGITTFQPSEVAKIAVILFITSQIMKAGREFYTLKGVFLMFVYGLIPAFGAYYFTDNLSTAVIIMAIDVFIVFIAHPKTRPFIIIFVLVTAAVVFVVYFLSKSMDSSESFRIRRVLTWLNPEEYSEYGGYQVLQGLYAIGSGGFFGKGLGNSTQKISTIPEAQNDMIFSIICEELGLFGAILLLLLFGYLLYRLFFISQNAPDLPGCLISGGIFAHISLQVILNVCVVLNVIPTTGVTLPFVSYGGTSIVFLMIEIGMAIGVSGQIAIRVEKPVKTKKNRQKQPPISN